MRTSTTELGRQAEQRAKKFLSARKLNLVDENYRTRFGEIDLIMCDGSTLVFIEVRYRRRSTYGRAGESIGRDKQSRIIRSAHEFLKTYPHEGPVRFDVVTFDGKPSARPEWIKNSFDAEW